MFPKNKHVLKVCGRSAAFLVMLLTFWATPSQAQLKVAADIQPAPGDGVLGQSVLATATAGGRVVVEVFATGYTNARGVEVILEVPDISAVQGDVNGSSGDFSVGINRTQGNQLKFAAVAFGDTKSYSGPLKLVASLTVTLSSTFTSSTINLVSVDFGGGQVARPPISFTVGDPNSLPLISAIGADMDSREGNQGVTNARINPGKLFPIEVYGGGLRGVTGYEIQLELDNPGNFDVNNVRFDAAPPFVVTPAKSSGGGIGTPVASSNPRAAADIVAGTRGDSRYNPENLSVPAPPGGAVAIELYGTGYTNVAGFTATLELANAGAVQSVSMIQAQTFPINLPGTAALKGNILTASLGFLGSTSAPSNDLLLLGTLVLQIGPNLGSGMGVTVKTISFQDATSEDLLSLNAVLNVTSSGGGSFVPTVEISGTTLIARATSPTPFSGSARLGRFGIATSNSFQGGQVTLSKVTVSTDARSTILEPRLLLKLGSAISNFPAVLRPPVPVTVTDTRAIIQWESDVNSTGKVLYGTAANALTQEAETDGQGRLHTVRISGLTLGTRYFYQVTNSDTRGTSDPFPPLPAQFFTRNFPDTQPPRILRGPVAYGITNNRADIVLDTDEAAVVDIQYGTAETALSLTVSRASTQLSHSLVLEALTPATQYFYRAKLTDLSGNNATTTGTKAFRTRSGADNLPPRILGRPAVLSRSFNATVIQWFTDEASNSTVLYGTSATTLTDSTAVDEAVRDHKVSLGNLGAGTEYFFQVKSADASGNVAITPVSPFITNSSEDTQAPIFVRQPGVVRSSNTEAVIVFETNEPTTAAVQYATTTDVYADDTGSVGETVNATDVSRNHKITLTNRTPTTRYHFKVSITDLANNGPTVNPGQRNFATRTLADTKAPVVFSRPVAQGITSSGAIIRWGADEPHSAVIRFGKITAGSPVTSADLSESIEDINVSQRHAVALADLTAGTTYAYEVETTDDAGNASKSVNLRFSTPSGVDTAPPVIVRGPVVRNITSTGATIEWLTNEISDSRVSVGTTTEYTSVVEESDGTREHSLTLTGLDAGTVYHYAVGSADQSGNVVTTDAVGTQIGLSKDHIFRTLATDDTLAPVITEGPIVEFTNELAVVKWRTDELSTSRVTIGLPSGSANIVAGSPVFGQTSELVFEDNDLVIYHSVTVTQLSAGIGYIYQASSTDASGNTVNTSTPSGASTKLQPPGGFGSFTTSTQADSQFPVITSGPTVVASTSSSMTIEWGTDESANSRVAFGISADSLGTQEISGTNLTTHRVVLTKLAAGTTYAYEVASTDASGNGETLSKVAYGTTPSTEDLTAPVITTGPTVIYKNDRSATLQWVTNEAANAEVAFGTLADSLINVRNLPDFETEHTVTLTNLSASTTYYYKASSTDQNNNGPATSATLNFTTESAPDTQVPVVSEVSASAADSTAIVTWKSDEVSDSSVRYGTASGTYDFNSGDATDVTSHTVTLTNLKPNTPYFYIVESIDRSGNGPTQSSEGTFTTASTGDVQAPAAPTGLLVTGGNNAVKLFWSASASAGVVGYLIERAVGGGAYAGLASIDPGTSYVDNNVTNGTSYSYRIASVGLKQLTSSASTASEAVTPAAGGGPSAPKLFALQGSQLTPTLAITNSTPLNASDVLNYTFHLASSADFSDAVALEAGLSSGAGTGTGDPSGVTAFTVSRTLTDGTTYYYRVKSSDGTFDSAYLTGSFKADAKAPQYPGDITGDRSVGFPDFLAFLGTFNKKEGQEGYLGDADLSGDGAIGFPDFLAFLGVFNKKYIKGPSSSKPIVEIAYGEDTEAQFQLVGRPVSLDEGGQEIAVDIRLSNASDLMGYGVRVTYDPANAQFISATDKGETLLTTDDRRAEIFGTLEHDAEKGEVFVAGAITSGIPVEGQGILATLHFRLLGSDPQKALIEIAQGLLIDGGLNANVAIHLGDRFALLPGEYALDHNFPNPFNPETTLKYALPKAGEVTLIVYNVLGQEIVRLVDAKQTPGYYTIRWNGQDALGHSVASGVYLCRIQAGDFNKTHKMMLLK